MRPRQAADEEHVRNRSRRRPADVGRMGKAPCGFVCLAQERDNFGSVGQRRHLHADPLQSASGGAPHGWIVVHNEHVEPRSIRPRPRRPLAWVSESSGRRCSQPSVAGPAAVGARGAGFTRLARLGTLLRARAPPLGPLCARTGRHGPRRGNLAEGAAGRSPAPASHGRGVCHLAIGGGGGDPSAGSVRAQRSCCVHRRAGGVCGPSGAGLSGCAWPFVARPRPAPATWPHNKRRVWPVSLRPRNSFAMLGPPPGPPNGRPRRQVGHPPSAAVCGAEVGRVVAARHARLGEVTAAAGRGRDRGAQRGHPVGASASTAGLVARAAPPSRRRVRRCSRPAPAAPQEGTGGSSGRGRRRALRTGPAPLPFHTLHRQGQVLLIQGSASSLTLAPAAAPRRPSTCHPPAKLHGRVAAAVPGPGQARRPVGVPPARQDSAAVRGLRLGLLRRAVRVCVRVAKLGRRRSGHGRDGVYPDARVGACARSLCSCPGQRCERSLLRLGFALVVIEFRPDRASAGSRLPGVALPEASLARQCRAMLRGRCFRAVLAHGALPLGTAPLAPSRAVGRAALASLRSLGVGW
mmetsp:Transcript_24689/g.93376  ORF Transcript_24689/g.93376 Transcript_24689/m.93376 type:complete len:577 (+) Transcript_24689:759-2489(+)